MLRATRVVSIFWRSEPIVESVQDSAVHVLRFLLGIDQDLFLHVFRIHPVLLNMFLCSFISIEYLYNLAWYDELMAITCYFSIFYIMIRHVNYMCYNPGIFNVSQEKILHCVLLPLGLRIVSLPQVYEIWPRLLLVSHVFL